MSASQNRNVSIKRNYQDHLFVTGGDEIGSERLKISHGHFRAKIETRTQTFCSSSVLSTSSRRASFSPPPSLFTAEREKVSFLNDGYIDYITMKLMIKARLQYMHTLNNTLGLSLIISLIMPRQNWRRSNGKCRLLVKIINKANVLTFVYVYQNQLGYLTAMTICVKIN